MSWSTLHERCIDGGTTERRHTGLGLCGFCYRRRRRAGTLPKRTPPPWSRTAPACVACHTTDIPHRAHGLCAPCYWKRLRSDPKHRQYQREYQRQYNKTDRRRTQQRKHNAKPESKAKKWLYLVMQRELRAGVWTPLPHGYAELVLDVFERRCAKCGSGERLELDHHRPLEDGHCLLGNCVLLCRDCNRRKHTKRPERFYDRWQLAELAMRLLEVRERLDSADGSC